jgi:hypothetical protein
MVRTIVYLALAGVLATPALWAQMNALATSVA